MKNWILAVLILTWVGVKAQDEGKSTQAYHRNELGIHGTVGWSNLSSVVVLNLNEPEFNPSAGIQWRFGLSKQLALYSTADYLVIEGSASVPTSKLTDRLTSIS